MKKILCTILLFCSILLIPKNVLAQQINDFHASYWIQKDGYVKVQETIVYDFGYASKHGIYRKIPLFKKNQQGKKMLIEISVYSVTNSVGTPYTFSTSTENDYYQIKIGDKDIFVSGENTYVITYTVKGAITYFSDHDEFYWNVTGNEWEDPISSAGFDVYFPEKLADNQIRKACYTGLSGSTESICTIKYDGEKVQGNTMLNLPTSSGLTIVVGFPIDMVSHIEPKEYVSFWDTILGKVVTMLLIVLGFFWYLVLPIIIPLRWYLFGRDPDVGREVTAWYDPPKTKEGRFLTPSETGTLIDENVQMRDIFAGIIDLARRGYFKIVEKKPRDFSFVKEREYQNDDSLEPFEQKLLRGLFKGNDVVRLKDRDLSEEIQDVESMLYEQVVKEGYFLKNPKTTRTIYIVLGSIALVTGNFLLAVILFTFGHHMPRKTILGAKEANVARGMKNFLSSQSRQLEFQAKNQMFFEKLLPFAVAFGVEKIWADRFKDITLTSPDWYQGYTAGRTFNTYYLLQGMNHSFSSFRTSATPTRSSSGFSSGFGGGGFSGGGGGGGGGGSW